MDTSANNAVAVVVDNDDKVITREFLLEQDEYFEGIEKTYSDPEFIGNIESGSNYAAKRVREAGEFRRLIKVSLNQLNSNSPITFGYGYCINKDCLLRKEEKCNEFMGKSLLKKVPEKKEMPNCKKFKPISFANSHPVSRKK